MGLLAIVRRWIDPGLVPTVAELPAPVARALLPFPGKGDYEPYPETRVDWGRASAEERRTITEVLLPATLAEVGRRWPAEVRFWHRERRLGQLMVYDRLLKLWRGWPPCPSVVVPAIEALCTTADLGEEDVRDAALVGLVAEARRLAATETYARGRALYYDDSVEFSNKLEDWARSRGYEGLPITVVSVECVLSEGDPPEGDHLDEEDD